MGVDCVVRAQNGTWVAVVWALLRSAMSWGMVPTWKTVINA